MADHTPHRYGPTPGPWYYSSGSVWVPRPGPGYPLGETATIDDIEGACVAMRSTTAKGGKEPNPIPPVERDRNMQLCAAAPRLRDALVPFIQLHEHGSTSFTGIDPATGKHDPALPTGDFIKLFHLFAGRAERALALATHEWNDYEKYIAAMREG